MKMSSLASSSALPRLLFRTLGATGVAGLGLSVVAITITLGVLNPMRAEIDALQRSIQAQPPASSPIIVAVPENSASMRTLQSLPDVQDLGPLLIAFAREAQRNHLAFGAAEYRWTPSTATHFGEYEIQFDATGNYLALRQFCAGVLNTQPAMSLRQLALSRESGNDTVLKAHMRWVIFVRDGVQ